MTITRCTNGTNGTNEADKAGSRPACTNRRWSMHWLTACWRTTGLGLACVLLILMPDSLYDLAFQYSRIADGDQLWRLVTAHWIHTDWAHLLGNLAALLVLGTMIEQRSVELWWLTLFGGMACIDLWLLSTWAALENYAGMSGVLNTFFTVAIALHWDATRQNWLWCLYAAGFAKLLLELQYGAILPLDTAWPAYVPAHAAGYLAGSLVVVCTLMRLPKRSAVQTSFKPRQAV